MTSGTSKKRMLLLELLFSVVIFAVCALICSLVYLRANTISTRSEELTRAVFATESAAEAFRSAATGDQLAGMLGGVEQDGGYRVYYDKNWEIAATGDAWLQLVVTPLDGKEAADITFYSNDQVIYRLTCQKLASEVE